MREHVVAASKQMSKGNWRECAEFILAVKVHIGIYSRELRKKQLDWLATNTNVITSQSHSLFACPRETLICIMKQKKTIRVYFLQLKVWNLFDQAEDVKKMLKRWASSELSSRFL
jgi:hypothetical protein